MDEPIPWRDLTALRATVRLARLARTRLGARLRYVDCEGRGVGPDAQPGPEAEIVRHGRGMRTRGERVPVRACELPGGGGLVVAPLDAWGRRLGYAVADDLPAGSVDPPDAWLSELVRAAAEEATAFFAELEEAGAVAEPRDCYGDIIGASRAMQHVYAVLDKLVRSDATVVIYGDNGTGKELVARAIHRTGARSRARFVVQNCSALNDNLLDSELFGHRRGAFTGAVSDKQGLFSVADGGTFFLDEIADTSPALQAKLLRVLQEGTFVPVGDTRPRRVDVRMLAASNQDLAERVRDGRFRQDLYYRLHVISVRLPALQHRRDDIPLLLDHFLARQAGGRTVGRKRLHPEARAALLAYDWPGNVRELENEVERLVVMSGDQSVIGLDLVSPRVRDRRAWDVPGALPAEGCTLPERVADLERAMIVEALRLHRGNKTRAAAALGVSRRNLIRKVAALGLER